MIDLNAKPSCNIFSRQPEAYHSLRVLVVGCLSTLLLAITGCGGSKSSSSSSSSSVTRNPVPTVASISPYNAPAGSRPLTLTVTGTNFISGSVVQWSGASRTTSYVNSTRLTAQITPDDLASTGTASVSVFNPSPGGGTSGSLTFRITSVSPLSILTALLPDGANSKAYSYSLQASGGITPYTWSVSSGSLPDGLTLSSDGTISGTPPVVADNTYYDFTIRLSDYAYQANTLTKPLSIRVRSDSLGRNDTCSAATPVSNGVIRASISPYADVDVYSFQGTAGKEVVLETYAQRLTLYGDSSSTDVFLDTFLELLDSNCSRLYYNDDIDSGLIQDSRISGYALTQTGTYYIRISDLRGDGRPDFIYELHVSGAD
ncbi:MAG: pre-peptidase C-terminal domain-containing protein [Acidobacteria bacterium]|nr:pre-peptidase C-terminal domain-containing protein [Acidobacteriota bacterium]